MQVNNLFNSPGGVIQDNSITINNTTSSAHSSEPVQDVVQEQVVNEQEDDLQVSDPIIRLNPDIDKVNFIRVLNAMCESSYFVYASGAKAHKSKVFAAFGVVLGEEFKNPANNLNSGKQFSSTDGVAAIEKTFDGLKNVALEYNSKSLDRKLK